MIFAETEFRTYLLGLALLVAISFSVGCAGPLGVFPGGTLAGPEVSTVASAFPAEALPDAGGVIQLETRPSDPYSVNLNARKIAGHVYLDPTEARAWFQHIQADARIRIRFPGDEEVYLALAIVEEDAEVVAQFASDRRVLRIEPRSR